MKVTITCKGCGKPDQVNKEYIDYLKTRGIEPFGHEKCRKNFKIEVKCIECGTPYLVSRSETIRKGHKRICILCKTKPMKKHYNNITAILKLRKEHPYIDERRFNV